MRQHEFPGGDFATGRLHDELVAAGVPGEWIEDGRRCVLIVQVEEDIAVGYEEPVVDEQGRLVMRKDGSPAFEVVWRRPNGEPVNVPAKLISDSDGAGAHVQLGPGNLVVHAAASASPATIAKIVKRHKP